MKSLSLAAAALGAAVLFLCAPGVGAQSSASYTIYLATTDGDGNLNRAGERPEFDCSDVVYLVVESDGPQQNEMSARWIGPAGKDRVRATRSFEQDRSRWWAWSGLKLTRPTGGGLLSLFDRSSGLEEFIGDWKVHVDVGPHRMTSIHFTVQC